MDGGLTGRRAPPENVVGAMFDRVAPRYDLLNGILSLGQVSRWRKQAARSLRSPAGPVILDLGCGTGALGGEIARRMSCRVVGVDASPGMLRLARAQLTGEGLVQASAFRLPFADRTFGAVGSAFVLRNLDDLPAALAELARVLLPGAPVALLDITSPRRPIWRWAFGLYFRTAAPALGALFGHRADYRYLVRSLAHLPPAAELCSMLDRSGFEEARARPLSGGAVTLFTARRGGAG